MASIKAQLMAQFYEQCQKKGYTDMRDATQSLKAKVIATDLGLRYGNMEDFYQKAELCYRQVQQEQEEAAKKALILKEQEEKEAQIRRQKEEKEAARRAVDGRLLLTITGQEHRIQVFLRPDQSVYSRLDIGPKIEKTPGLTVKKSSILYYKYNPSELVYTGASSGGITMGGFHQTEASYSERMHDTDKGYIQASLSGTEFRVELVTVSEYVIDRFKRDKLFNRIVSDGLIKCCHDSQYSKSLGYSVLTGSGNLYTSLTELSMLENMRCLPYKTCQEILPLLEQIICCRFPPTDKKIYSDAMKIAAGTTSAEVVRAIAMLQGISDYMDTAEQIKHLQQKYEELLQTEKEQAVIAREAREKKSRKFEILAIPVFAVAVLLILVFSKPIRYSSAVKFMEAGDYQEAIAAFEQIRSYRDSIDKIAACKKAITDNVAAEYGEDFVATFATLQEGDSLIFGHYEQDNDLSNGSEAIEWRVLLVQDDKALVISKYALDYQPYNTIQKGAAWSSCSLRGWLNDNFLNTAFSKAEKACIPTVTITADAAGTGNANGKKGTQDRIFLLSTQEATAYFSGDDDRICRFTAYAAAAALETEKQPYSDSCHWWLRTPGQAAMTAVQVGRHPPLGAVFPSSYAGQLDKYGYPVQHGSFVRPAMWIDLTP